MKHLITFFYLLVVLANNYAFGQLPKYPWTAKVNVIGEDNNPIVGANVSVQYTILPQPTDPNEKRYGEVKGLTDNSGIFSASHIDSSWGLAIVVEKSGYYTTHIGHELYQPGQFDDKTVNANRNPIFKLLLKKIDKPIAMYAKRINSLKVPEFNKAIGYDLMIGDWVGPYGKGINADLFFTEKHTDPQSGYILSVSFPNSGDGIQEFSVPDTERGSALRSSHEALVDGYQRELAQTETTNPNRNFYFRVRTKLDENGNVVSARYGKIYGDLAQFTYYFNPTPNDRNVEFDTKQNLIGGEQVSAP